MFPVTLSPLVFRESTVRVEPERSPLRRRMQGSSPVFTLRRIVILLAPKSRATSEIPIKGVSHPE
jgi:hypothetical protein